VRGGQKERQEKEQERELMASGCLCGICGSCGLRLALKNLIVLQQIKNSSKPSIK